MHWILFPTVRATWPVQDGQILCSWESEMEGLPHAEGQHDREDGKKDPWGYAPLHTVLSQKEIWQKQQGSLLEQPGTITTVPTEIYMKREFLHCLAA